jgi:Tfp pilus assembly protein PilF
MSRTLNLCEHLLYQGRRFFHLGADQRALRTFSNLAHLRELPEDIAEETQYHLASLLIKQGEFARARRHLTAALVHDPSNAEYHYLMASAHDQDPKGSHRLSLKHYRRAVELDSENAFYHADAGLFAVSNGQVELGLRWLRTAAKLAPSDPEVVGDVVRVLQEQGHGDEAHELARSALFRNSRDPRFVRLWNDCRFQEVHRHQQQIKSRQVVRAAATEAPNLLSFHKLTVMTPTGRKLLRRDGASARPTPHMLRLGRQLDKKHA